jgi:hypothetical protein
MDDKWPSMVAKSVSHPTVDDLGLVPNTPCNLRVVFVTHSAVIHSTAGHSSFPADADCESPSRPARRPQTPKLRRRCIANPHFVSLCLKAQSPLLQHYHRDALHRHHTPSPFRQRYVFSFVAAAAAFAGFSSFRVVFCRWFAIRVKRFSTRS